MSNRNEAVDLQVWIRAKPDAAAEMLASFLAIGQYQLDLQWHGFKEPENRRWRAFQNLDSAPSADGDLHEGYGRSPEDAIAACVSAIEGAEPLNTEAQRAAEGGPTGAQS